jgi:hypothetical protein
MKIFKELKKLGYIHYSAATIEELDDLPLNSAERVSEQALVLKWFREIHGLYSTIRPFNKGEYSFFTIVSEEEDFTSGSKQMSYEEAESACIDKLIELVKEKINHEA